MEILLIGLNHSHQLAGYAKASSKLQPYLEDLCLKQGTDIVAEELNEEAINKWKAHDSIARETATSLGVRHLFCDPDSKERKALGIKCYKEIAQQLGYGRVLTREQSSEVKEIEETYWEKRERFWLDKLVEEQFDKCVFLVGADHVDRFNALLTAHGFQSSIVEKDWEP